MNHGVDWNEVIQVSRLGLHTLGPECVLIVLACLAIVIDLFLPRERSGPTLAWVALLGTVGATWLATQAAAAPPAPGAFDDAKLFPFWHALAQDGFGSFFKVIILFGTIFSIVLVHESVELRGRSIGEFYGLMFLSVAGMCLMVSANDMVTAFLAIELVSVPSFALVGYLRQDRHGTEASLKYVLYAAFSTGLMLFGFSILYGFTRTTRFSGFAALMDELAKAQQHGVSSSMVVTSLTIGVAGLLAFGGFAYKMAAAPFHFWAPDVYQGASTPVTAWLSVTSKAAGIGLFTRFIAQFMTFKPEGGHQALAAISLGGFDWVTAVAVIAAITMTIGNLGALYQTSLKRLLAYSSVAHVGYMLMGIAAIQATRALQHDESVGHALRLAISGDTSGYGATGVTGGSAVAFYMAAYVFMNIGAFTCVIAVQNATGTDEMSSFRALGRRAPIVAVAFAVFLIALVGIPPTVGFTGKLQLFMAAIERAADRRIFWALVGVAGVNTAISVYYYLRVIKTMFLEGITDPESREPLPVSPGLVVMSALLMVPVVILGLAFNRLVNLTNDLWIMRG